MPVSAKVEEAVHSALGYLESTRSFVVAIRWSNYNQRKDLTAILDGLDRGINDLEWITKELERGNMNILIVRQYSDADDFLKKKTPVKDGDVFSVSDNVFRSFQKDIIQIKIADKITEKTKGE